MLPSYVRLGCRGPRLLPNANASRAQSFPPGTTCMPDPWNAPDRTTARPPYERSSGAHSQRSLIDRSPVSNQARSSYKWVQTLQTDVRESLQLHCEKSYTQMAHDVPQERLDQNLCSGAR